MKQLTAVGIKIWPGEVLEVVVRDDALEGVQIADHSSMVPRTALFVFPRLVPRTDGLTRLECDTDEQGFIVVDATGATVTPAYGRPETWSLPRLR